jgi:type IV fimbrial biogenesis protein FimT
MHTSAHRRHRGFTLVEALVVLAIVGVLLRVAFAGLQDVAAASRISAATYQLVSELNHARSEAIRRNTRVVVCKSGDGESCTGAGDWDQGWIVFHDDNNNALREGSEAVIRRGERTGGRLRIMGNETVSRYVSFTPFGGPRFTSGAFQAGTITLCHESVQPVEARQLIINAAGRPRTRKVTLASCGAGS